MPSLAIDLEANPYLLPEQQAMVDRIDGVVERLEISDEGVHAFLQSREQFTELARSAGGYLLDEVGFERASRRKLPRKIKTEEDLEMALRYQDVVAVTRDRMLTMAQRYLALDLGYAVARKHDEDIHAATELGARLVEVQASSATQALLIADRHTFFPATGIGERVSSWDRAKEAFDAHPRVRPPVVIDDREGKRFDILSDRMRDMTEMADSVGHPKVNKSRILNLAKVAHKGVQALRHANGKIGVTLTRELLDNPLFPVIPILSGKDTGDAHRTMRRKVRYFQGAARLDAGLVTDPKVRSYVYLFDQLGGRDTSSVKQALERDSKKVKAKAVKEIQKAQHVAELAEEADDSEE